MSYCNPCTKSLPISICTEQITIGSISNINANVNVYFKNVATGKIHSYEGSSNDAGEVSIDGPFDFARNQDYEAWVTLDESDSINENKTITIGYDSMDCLIVSFVQVWDSGAGYPVNFTNQTLEVDE